MYSWSVNTSIINTINFLKIGSCFVLAYTIITQLPPLQVNYSSNPPLQVKSSSQNNLYVENSITISAINLMLGIKNKQPLEMSSKKL